MRVVETSADHEARRRIREDLDDTLVVEAAAGTGKTTALVGRIVALLRTGRAKLSEIIAVTFTEPAAGEMKLRVRAEVERARADLDGKEEERRRLDQALAELEVARIATIHALCADILRERPVEAKVDPLFEVAADDAQRLYDTAFDAWFARQLGQPGGPDEGVRRVLRRRARGPFAEGPRSTLREAGWRLIEHRDFAGEWRRDPFDREKAIDEAVLALEPLRGLAAQAESEKDWLKDNVAHVERFLDDLARREALRPRDYDGLEAELRELKRHKTWKYTGRGRYSKELSRNEVIQRRDAAKSVLDELIRRSDADLAACLSRALKPLVGAYTELKARAGKLDFLDLLILARDLIRDDRSVREDLQARFTHVLVDEFQDTDPLQAEILLLLTADDPAETDWNRVRPKPGKLFLVGDPKQSIYRFRRADVARYEEIKRRLVASGASVVALARSFRSTPNIQRLVNASFEPIMQGGEDGAQAGYIALEPVRPEAAGRPSVVVLPVPRPYGDFGKIVTWRIEESLPDAVGAFAEWLVRESGWKVQDKDAMVPVEARHVCLLFRRFQSFGEDVTRPYVRALEARRIPHVLVGGRSYHAREEVLAIRNALSAIEWPDDELMVYATLRGPLFALGDDALLEYKAAFKTLNPLRIVDATTLATQNLRDVDEALAILRRLHGDPKVPVKHRETRNTRPIADTLGQLLAATRAHAGIAIWPTGEQALGNILRMLDLARRFEAGGARSFRAFVERVTEEAERGEASEAAVVEEGTEGVRIMTAHKAKGLEFPVVILVDPTAPFAHKEPSWWVDEVHRVWAMPLAGCIPSELDEHRDEVLARDAAESARLAYVAATRAKDLLVVPAVGDPEGPAEGWLKDLLVVPGFETRREPKPAPGCPAFGTDTVLERPEDRRWMFDSAVAPGRHELGTHEVVWWDPRALSLDKEHDVGLRQQKILEADKAGTVAHAGALAHEAWQSRRRALLSRGKKPTLEVRTATELVERAARAAELAPELPLEPREVPLEHTDAARSKRPGGKRFGTLVHAVLAVAPLDADEKVLRGVADSVARNVGAKPWEIAAAVEAAAAALRHPLLDRARRASEVRREAPVVFRLDDGSIADGVLDLAFKEEGGWTVVDFKTDRELDDAWRAVHESQLRLYAQAITAATGEPTRAYVLAV